MEETRVNASYLARLVGFILALILFALVIWFVVQLGQDENGTVATNDEENATTSVTESRIGGGEVVVIDGTGDGSQIAATDEQLVATSQTQQKDGITVAGTATVNSSANMTPETGPVDMTLGALAIGLAVVSFQKYRQTRLALQALVSV